VDIILVGLPGSGKSAIGRRLAARHRAAFIDLDDAIEAGTGRSIPEIFAEDGEATFRALERAAVAALGPPDAGEAVARVVATGGGAVVDPRNRWQLYRGRLPVWLDGRPEVLAQRLRRSPHVRPLVTGREPIAAVRDLGRRRERFYAAAHRIVGMADVRSVVAAVDDLVATAGGGGAAWRRGTSLLSASTPIGRYVLGDGMAAEAVSTALHDLGARRAILVSEPGARAAAGDAIAASLTAEGWPVEVIELPRGEAAKRLAVVETAARRLAELRAERREPLVAIGGGALGDAAGFLAATWLRGVPLIHVPTTLVAQIDSAIGGKTAVDLDEGKNLVGAFHRPSVIVTDVAFLRTLDERQRRAALGEAVKMAVLGDGRLFEVLESDGDAIARGEAAAFDSGAVAEVVERCAWAKVEVVADDEREAGAVGGRITLNLGHSVGHGLEAADGYRDLLHGEAVAHGLRAASRIALELELVARDRVARIEALLDRLGLGIGPLALPADAVRVAMGRDKKHAAGRLRWVLPSDDGVVVRDDVPEAVVDPIVDGILAGRTLDEVGAAGTAGQA
jgi:3-dehydroquinate synthetase/shikimate kinase